MAISDAQKVDYLFKKIGFGISKTDISTNKSPANESISSPLLIRGDNIWDQSDSIANGAVALPTSNVVVNGTTVVAVYRDSLSSAVQTTNDGTAAVNRTWKTGLTNWIGPEFGTGYQLKVYTGTVLTSANASTGTSLSPDGSGNNDGWFFDYQSGVLNFADTNVPTTISTQVWVVGARYTGPTGISTLPNLVVTGNLTSTNGNIVLTNGNVYAQNYYGTFQGTIGAGTSIAVANVANYDVITPVSTSPNTFYPKLSNIVVAGNSVAGVATNLSFVPSTGTLTATAFSGSGSALTSLTATNVAGTVATANVSLYDSVTAYTTNQTFYPQFSNLSTTGNSVTGVATNLSFNPSTGALTATSFSGTLSAVNVAGTVATANATVYTGITNTATGTYYPVLSAQNTTGNAQAAASSSLSYNAATGTLTATSFAGYGGALTGTMTTANVGLYEQITNLTNNQTYYLPFANVVTGNSTLGAVTSVNVNPSTGQVNSVSANVTTLNVGSTSILAGQVQIPNSTVSTNFGSGALVVSGGLGVAGAAFFNSNVSIAGNLTVTGNSVSIGASTLSITDPIINLNTPQDLTPLTVPTTSDVGLKFHYYDTADSAAFAGRTVVDGYFTYWTKGTDTANVFTGTQLGTFKGGATILANARVVGGGLSANTGSMQVWGDASITGNLYVGNGLQNTPIGTLGSSTGNFTTVTAQTVNAATIGNSGASIVGTISATGVAGTVATANAAIYTGITNTATGTYYPVLSAQNTTGNAQAAASSSLSYNAATGALTATSFAGYGGALTGTMTTANVALYEQITNLTNNQTYYLPFANLVTGNSTLGAVTAVNVNPSTGNVSATAFIGSGQYLTNISIGSLSGTYPTANVAIYEQVTAYTTNQTFYPVFSNISTTGNTVAGVNSSLSYNPSTGALTATSFSGTLSATNVSGTTATANVSLYDSVTAYTTNQTFYPQFSNISTTGNSITGVSSSLSYNPSTGTLTATNFNGTVQGTVATANAAIYTGITNTASGTYYPVLSAQNTTGNAQTAASSSLSYNAATGALTATSFSGTLSAVNVAGTVATANVSLYESVTAYTTNQTFYPVFSNTSSSGNTVAGVATNLSFNPSSGTLSATVLNGTVTALNVSGTVATANVALYASATPYTTNQTFYPVFSNTVTAGNTTVGVNSGLSYNPATGTLTATNFAGAISGTIGTANVSLYESVTALTTNQTFYPQFSNISTTGNTISGVATNLTFNPGTGVLTATTFSGAGSFSTVSTSGVASLNANVVINNGSNTNDNTSGGLVIKGTAGAAIGGNINVGSAMFIGSGAQATVLNSPIAIKRGTPGAAPGFQYLQDALISATNYGSSDFIAYGNNYTGVANDHGFVDLGFTGDAFTDPYYSITKSNDGYVFASGANATVGGNLVLATDYSGNYNDVVVGVGSFYANSEVARFHGNASNSGTFVVKLPTNASPAANTGAFQVWGGASFGSNVYVGGAVTINGGQTAGNELFVRGKTDTTLIWARPNATYDQVLIGGSATAAIPSSGAKLQINSTDSILLPSGSNAQRPGSAGFTDVTGMFRYSTTSGAVEWYTGSAWQSASSSFTVVTDQQFNGDGVTTAFTLSAEVTTNATIVSINGVLQIPTLAYAVSGTTLTFTEAPANLDVIDVRSLTTTQTVTGIASTNGYMQVAADNNGVYIYTGVSSTAATTVWNTGGARVSNIANVSVASAATPTTIDTINNTLYRSAKYVVQVTNGANYQVQEALVISNGTVATITTYGAINTGGNLGVLSATQSGANTLVQFTAVNATNSVRIQKDYLNI